jgi:NDP-sugar pyrophosphorylase family protein
VIAVVGILAHPLWQRKGEENIVTDSIILCGGAGLRLRPVTGDVPKSMARVSGRPFLETLLRQLQRYGFSRAILGVGFAADAIQDHFGDRFYGVEVEYSTESSPLGTGGALRNAVKHVRSASFLAMNGDSYTDVDLREFAIAHGKSEADVSVVVVPVDERGDAGSIHLDDDRNVVQFAEKERSSGSRHLNAGIYMISREMLCGIPEGLPISLERELFPKWIQEGRRIKAFVHSGKCVDIGTPERFRAAQEILARVEAGAKRAGDEE